MTTLREAAQQALESCNKSCAPGYCYCKEYSPKRPASIMKPEITDHKPFGYFRAEPFGWTDCAPTDEGAIPLYERPQIPPEAQTEAEKVAYCAGWWDALAKKREQK